MILHSIDILNKKAIIDHQGNLIEVEWFTNHGEHCLTTSSRHTCTLEGVGDISVIALIRNHLASAPKHELESPDPKANEKQPRYTNEQGFDLIDEWAENYPIEIFRVLMWEQMRKYHRRLGKKDSHASEVAKIADYARRWSEVENRKIAYYPH